LSLNLDGDIPYFYYSNDWSADGQRQKQNKPVCYKAFNPDDNIDAAGEEEGTRSRQIFWFIPETPGTFYYTYPKYEAAVDGAETEIGIINFHRQNVANGYAPSFTVNFTNTPSPEEQDEIVRSIEKKYKGTDATAKILVTFSEPGMAPTFTPIETNKNDSKFKDNKQDTVQDILTAHGIASPMLIGRRTEGQLGGRTEIIEAAELMQNTIISKNQGVIERQWNILLPYFGIKEKAKIKPFKIINPISLSISENNLLNVLSREEIRKMLGIEEVNPPVPATSEEKVVAPGTAPEAGPDQPTASSNGVSELNYKIQKIKI